MTTTPTATPATTPTGFISHWVAFAKAHEKIIITIVLGVALTLLGNHLITVYDNHLLRADTAAQLKAQASVDSAQKQIQTDNTQNAILAKQLSALQAQVAVSNAKLSAQIAAQKIAVQKQQTIDATLPLPELANRWVSLVNLQPQDVAAVSNTVVVSPNGASATVQKLELVPGLTDENAKLNLELTSDQNLIGKQIEDIDALTKTIADRDTALAAERTLHAADVKDLKDQLKTVEHRTRGKWFKVGFVAGAATVLVVEGVIVAVVH